MEQIVWGLDIGGTKSALVIGDRAGNILARWQVDTASYDGNWRKLLDTLLAYPENMLPAAVGISCGGPLDSRRGLILSPPNLPGWDEVPIVKYVSEKIGVPAYLQNDANACALAEWRFGAGRGTTNMAFLTFGTGMGAGLILNGQLYSGTSDMAGEIGHVRLEKEGPIGYGKAGSVEGFCSGGGLFQLARQELGCDLTAKQLIERADASDVKAIQVLHKSARYLGQSLAILIDLLNLERIVIGSIFTRAERWFREEALRVIQEEALPLSYSCCEIVPAQLGERIGDIASLTVAFNGLGERMHDK